MCLIHWLGGRFRHMPEELHEKLSDRAMDLVKRSFEDIDPATLTDFHTHLAGLGVGGTNAFVNPKMLTWRHPFHHLKFAVYNSACLIRDLSKADSEMVSRLVSLVENIPQHGKHMLLAFDKYYRPDGTVDLDKTQFYVPNEYVFRVAQSYPNLFSSAMSVHPYRPDALAELEIWARQGGRVVKWLPNAMGMDPAHEKCDDFYRKMKELDLVLLSHGGEEKAVEAEEDQKLGNPLLLRRALDHGVKVIVAHCAGLGENEDLDNPRSERRTNFEYFLRLMDDPKYEGLVFGEISAMTQFNRLGTPLTTILDREDLYPRLINGSDYPLPAINLLVRTGSLAAAGYIDRDQRPLLNEIYGLNPLLFDFVLKRCLRSPETRRSLPPSVFCRTITAV